MYSSGHRGTFNLAVVTNKEVHMVPGNINKDDEASQTTSNAKKKNKTFRKRCGNEHPVIF